MFSSKLFQTALTTIHLQTDVNKSLLGLRGEIIPQIFKHFDLFESKTYFERKNEIMI